VRVYHIVINHKGFEKENNPFLSDWEKLSISPQFHIYTKSKLKNYKKP